MFRVNLGNLSGTSLEISRLKRFGTASKAIERISVVSQDPVDEFLYGSDQQIRESAIQLGRKTVGAFAEIYNPGGDIFVGYDSHL